MRLRYGMMVLLAASIALPAQAQNANQLKQTLQRLEATKREEKKLAGEIKNAEAELKTLQSKATRLAAEVQRSEAEMIRAERGLRAASIKRDAAMKEFATGHKAYKATVMTLLRMKQLPPSIVLAPADKLDDMRVTAMSVTELERALRTQLAGLKRTQEKFLAAQEAAKKARDQVARGQTNLKHEQAKLDAALTKRKQTYGILESRHAKARAEAAGLAQSSKNLADLIAKLDAKSRVEASKALTLRSINTAKGSLRTPVAGSIRHRYGQRKNVNETYRGVVIASRASATVVAPFDGEIAYSGSFREYGPMVVIRHSHGYMSLLAGLGATNVLVGTKVRAGEPVGKMGTNPVNLYVELRERSKPIDPAPWYAKL